MTPEQRRAEIEKLEQELNELYAEQQAAWNECCSAITELEHKLAALEAEVGHEPKETNDGEA